MDSFDLKLPINLAQTFLELHCNLRLLLLISFLHSLSFIDFTLHCDPKALLNFSSSLSFTLHKLSLHCSPPQKSPAHQIPLWHLDLRGYYHKLGTGVTRKHT